MTGPIVWVAFRLARKNARLNREVVELAQKHRRAERRLAHVREERDYLAGVVQGLTEDVEFLSLNCPSDLTGLMGEGK